MRSTTPLLCSLLTVVACGGATFIGVGDAGNGDGGGSSSGSTSSGSTSSGSSGSSGGSGSSGSGSSSGSSSGGSSGGSTSGGSSGSPEGPACPANPPMPGTGCSGNGVTCEWGTGNDPVCDDTVETCTSGFWVNPYAGAGACASSPPIMCPATYASVPRMTHCAAYGGWCDYPQGRCACSVPAGGGVPLDASAEAIWICQDPSAPGCPTPRPRLGSPCSQEGLSCDYGACDVPGGSAEQCTGGLWQPGNIACPLAAAGAGSR